MTEWQERLRQPREGIRAHATLCFMDIAEHARRKCFWFIESQPTCFPISYSYNFPTVMVERQIILCSLRKHIAQLLYYSIYVERLPKLPSTEKESQIPI